MRKKVISVFMMAAFLVMACLAGCGQAGETQEASDSLTPSSQTESTPSTTENETEDGPAPIEENTPAPGEDPVAGSRGLYDYRCQFRWADGCL